MGDAKTHKQRWKKRLCDLEVESLLALRDSIMASGAAYMMVLKDTEKNSAEIKKDVSEQPT